METSQISLEDAKKRLIELDRRILPLQWDADHNQLNAGKVKILADLRKEKDELRVLLASEQKDL